jgi:hypothetical protein
VAVLLDELLLVLLLRDFLATYFENAVERLLEHEDVLQEHLLKLEFQLLRLHFGAAKHLKLVHCLAHFAVLLLFFVLRFLKV